MYTIKVDHMDLNQIADSGQCFRWRKLDEHTYSIPTNNSCLVISQDKNLFTVSCDEDDWHRYWKNYFDIDTDTDYDEVEEIIMKSDDKFLKTAYQYGSGIRILRQDLWEVIVSFIISQNNNIPRIKKCIEKICDSNDGKFPTHYEILNMNLSDKGLGYRDNYLINASEWWYRFGDLLYESNNPKEMLIQIKGIGEKVSNCICLFGLHNLKAFPIDVHIKRILDREYNGELPEWIKYKYAGLFQQYIFYYELNYRNNKGE